MVKTHMSRQHHLRKAILVRMGDEVRLPANMYGNFAYAFQPVARIHLRTTCRILSRVSVKPKTTSTILERRHTKVPTPEIVPT